MERPTKPRSALRGYIAVSLAFATGYWLAFVQYGAWAATGHALSKIFN